MTHGRPPPLQRDRCRASCVRHACVVPATCVLRREDDKPPPPPHTPPPPQGWGMQVGGGEKRPPPPGGQSVRVGRQRREGAGRTTRPCPKRARAVQAPAGGPPGVRTQGRKGDDGSHKACPPPPTEGQVPRLMPAPCLRPACDMRAAKGRRQAPPPHTHLRPPKGGG